jgi:hypothetical protein
MPLVSCSLDLTECLAYLDSQDALYMTPVLFAAPIHLRADRIRCVLANYLHLTTASIHYDPQPANTAPQWIITAGRRMSAANVRLARAFAYAFAEGLREGGD